MVYKTIFDDSEGNDAWQTWLEEHDTGSGADTGPIADDETRRGEQPLFR